MPERPPPGPIQGEIWPMLAQAQQRRQERQGRPVQFQFLSDPRDASSIALDSPALAALEGLARQAATRAYPDAGLSAFTLAVQPFARQEHARAAALFTYSSINGRTRLTLRVDAYGLVEPAAASEDSLAGPDPQFPAPPWEPDNGWRDRLRQAYSALEPLSPHELSAYYLAARARYPGRWEAIFQDGRSGHESVFEWTGPGALVRRK